jgi:hypothetical protein
MDDGMQASHEDAQLILKLYELRREEKMRAGRDWFARDFFPRSVDDIKAVWFDPASPHNAHFRMVTSYWDMAASFVVHGALHARLFLESGSEMILVWAMLEDFIPQLRKDAGLPNYLENIERVIESEPWAMERLEWLRAIVRRRREDRKD